MAADPVSPRPSQFPIKLGHRIITVTQYLPYVKYHDITEKTVYSNMVPSVSATSSVKGLIFFGPAMAVRAGYYRYFLDYFSTIGYIAYTFDYSGIDSSKMDSIKNSDLTMTDWIDDLQQAVDWVLANYEGHLVDLSLSPSGSLPKFYLCHSLSGQFFGFLSNQNDFDKFVGITSQNGYWRFYTTKWRYFFFWYFLQPLLTSIFGYFPSQKVGFGEDLPPLIMKRWKKWCTSRNYFFDDDEFTPNYSSYSGKILTIGLSDDPWATFDAIEDLYTRYDNADWEHWEIDPAEINLDEIGHMGYFRPKSIELWQRTAGWLEV